MKTNPQQAPRRSFSARDVGVGITLGLAAATAMGLWMLRDDPDEEANRSLRSAVNEPSTLTLEQLAQDLATEIEARRTLSERIQHLEARLETFAQASTSGTTGERASSEQDLETEALAEAGAETADSADGDGRGVFDVDALLDLGIDPRDVDRLHELWARHALDRAAINDRAMREGWFMKPRHGAELAATEKEFREELGDDEDYDQYLFAVGQPNRLIAREVLDGSAASEAGLRRGDTILRYDGERVFTTADLLRATSQGEPGSSVRVTILRDEGTRTVSLRRGPIGVILTQRSAPPPTR